MYPRPSRRVKNYIVYLLAVYLSVLRDTQKVILKDLLQRIIRTSYNQPRYILIEKRFKVIFEFL